MKYTLLIILSIFSACSIQTSEYACTGDQVEHGRVCIDGLWIGRDASVDFSSQPDASSDIPQIDTSHDTNSDVNDMENDTSDMDSCGNGFIDEPAEECDDTKFGSETCTSLLGYDAKGELTCSSDCSQITVEKCIPVYKKISAGKNHMCGILSNHKVKCWGNNEKQQAEPHTDNFTDISSGNNHTCGINTDNQIHCWGDDKGFNTDFPTGIVFKSISSGVMHTCGITETGKALCWGNKGNGRTIPQKIQGRTNLVHIDIFNQNSCALDEDGAVVSWGNFKSLTGPELKGITPNVNLSGIAASNSYTCGIKKSDSKIECWGYTEIDFGETVYTKIDSGSRTVCAINENDTIDCKGASNKIKSHIPPGDFQLVTVGFNFACALDMEGQPHCWGENNFGQIIPPAATLP